MKRSDVVATINGLEGEAGHQRILNVYNSQCPLPRGYRLTAKDAWCAATVTAVYLLNGFDGVSECSCPRMIEKAKALGIWQESDSYIPKPGDCIMYDWQDSGTGDGVGVADHTGIVIEVDGQMITVREGNKNKSIGNRQIKVDGRYTFEIGGRSKDFSQIAGVKDSYIFADDWDIPDGAKLPLWMLGFLY